MNVLNKNNNNSKNKTPMKKTLTKRTLTEANVNPTRNTVNNLKISEDKKPIKKIEKNNKDLNKSQDISNSNLKKKIKQSKSVPKMGKNKTRLLTLLH